MAVEKDLETRRVDRRALLRKAAAAGAVGWTAPVILTSAPAAAGVFTAKCAPGNVTVSSVSFVQVAGSCTDERTEIDITINFAGPCPCGGTPIWCGQLNTPARYAPGTITGSTLRFRVRIPIFNTIPINGRVALGCTDRNGDRQYARYNWSMTATDNGNACPVANSISGVTLSGRTLVPSVGCPSLAASSLAGSSAEVLSAPAVPPGYVRPAG